MTVNDAPRTAGTDGDRGAASPPPAASLNKRDFLKAAGGGLAVLAGTGVVSAATQDDVRINSIAAPPEAARGSSIQISATLENLDTVNSKTTTIEYRIGSQVIATASDVVVDPGQTRTVDFSPDPTVPTSLSPGAYTQGVFFGGTGIGSTTDLLVRGSVFAAANFSAPGTAQVGQQVSASATVSNTGNESGTVAVHYKVDGQTVSSQSVTLAGGASVSLAFVGTVPSMSDGTKTQGIYFDDSGAAAASSTVVVGPSTSRFQVNSIDAEVASSQAGGAVSIQAVVQNTGTASGTTRFEYRIGNQRIARTDEITLDVGATRTITLEGTVPELAAGQYLQGVFVGTSNTGLTTNFRVTADGPSYSVQSLEAPSRAERGETVAVRARVRNSGNERGTTTFRYRIDGESIVRREVTLQAGETRWIDFDGVVPDLAPDSYTQGVFVGDTTSGLTTSLRVTPPATAVFDISRLRAPGTAQAGSEVTVSATVTNNGGRRGSTAIQYRIGDRVVGTTDVDLRDGRSTTVRFDVTVPDLDRGNYKQGVFVGTSSRGATTNLEVRPSRQFRLSGLVATRSVTVGSQISIQVTVRNESGSTASRTVEYRIGDRVIAERDVTLDAGASRTITLDGTVPDIEPATYTQGVYVDAQRLDTTLELLAGEPTGEPRFAISDLNAPASGLPGAEIEVGVTVTNTGGERGETVVEYRFDGDTLASQTVELAAGDSRDLTFDVSVPESPPATYRHGVFVGGSDRGQTSSFVVEAEATPTRTATSTPTETTGGFGPGFGAIAAAVSVLGGGYLLQWLRRGTDRD